MNQQQARNRIDDIIDSIKEKWKEAQKIADDHIVPFVYSSPDNQHSGTYYPKRPDDWVVWDDYAYDLPEGYEEDPNKNHPEHHEYHPWNNCGEYERDWSHGNWISSSERC
jgi:hypothetical protein